MGHTTLILLSFLEVRGNPSLSANFCVFSPEA
jgi:hypothetical protein